MPWRCCEVRRALVGPVIAAALAAILAWGALTRPTPAPLTTDRLGPEAGEPVSHYLARARDSLTGNGSEMRWALISFTTGLTADQLPARTAGLRVAQVIYHVPIDRVQTPILTVPTPAGPAPRLASARAAAGAIDPELRPAGPWNASLRDSHTNRADAIAAVTAARLRAGCACAAALVVRGPLDSLRALATPQADSNQRSDTNEPEIRAVEALGPDAAAGMFAVVPLLPEHRDAVLPEPDDGPVPAH